VSKKRAYWRKTIKQLSEPWKRAKEEEAERVQREKMRKQRERQQAEHNAKAAGANPDNPNEEKNDEMQEEEQEALKPPTASQINRLGDGSDDESDGFEMIEQADGSQLRSPKKRRG
jgi:hypothetical protein